MIVRLLTEHHLEFLSLKGGCRGSSESTHVKMPHFWKSHALAQMYQSAVDSLLEALKRELEYIQHNGGKHVLQVIVLASKISLSPPPPLNNSGCCLL